MYVRTVTQFWVCTVEASNSRWITFHDSNIVSYAMQLIWSLINCWFLTTLIDIILIMVWESADSDMNRLIRIRISYPWPKRNQTTKIAIGLIGLGSVWKFQNRSESARIRLITADTTDARSLRNRYEAVASPKRARSAASSSSSISSWLEGGRETGARVRARGI